MTKRHAWKTPTPASVAWINNQRDRAGASATQYRTDGKINCLRALVYCCQVRAVAAQDELRDPYVRVCIYLLAALGFIALMWKIWQFNLWLYRLPAEPPDDFDPDGPRQVTLQMRLLGPRDNLVLRVQRGNDPRNAEQAAQIVAEPTAEAEPPAEAEPQPAVEQQDEGSEGRSIDEEYEQLWQQRAAEAFSQGMTPEQIVQWRRREERAIYTGQYEESSDERSDSEEEADVSPNRVGFTEPSPL